MSSKIRISGIVNESIVDGPGIRMVIFAQGCKHNCEGCHNPQTHSFDGGEFVTIEKIINDLKKNSLLDGVTLSGGDPFEQAEKFAELAQEVNKIGMNVITYTGYTYEQILELSTSRKGYKELINNTFLLIDGPFILAEKNLLLQFRGSKNQRIIDVEKSLESNQLVLWNK